MLATHLPFLSVSRMSAGRNAYRRVPVHWDRRRLGEQPLRLSTLIQTKDADLPPLAPVAPNHIKKGQFAPASRRSYPLVMELNSAFSAKFGLALKALSMTRGQVAAQLAVDKSLVGRWATGAAKPSTHNLSRLSTMVAERVGHFTNLDWDRDLGSLALKLGVDEVMESPKREALSVQDFLSPLFGDILAMTDHRAAAYEGFHVSTRAYYQNPGKFIRDRVMIRKASNGLLQFTQVTGGVAVDGWIMALHSQLFVVGVEKTSRSLVFCIGNGVNAFKSQAYEGIALYCALDAGRTPIATPFVTERVGDLSGDREADDAWFAEFAALPPIVAGADLSPELQAHLTRDFGASELARGGDWLLAMPIARSLSKAFDPD